MVLETERLLLREMNMEDCDVLFKSIGMRFDREYPDKLNRTTHVPVFYSFGFLSDTAQEVSRRTAPGIRHPVIAAFRLRLRKQAGISTAYAGGHSLASP